MYCLHLRSFRRHTNTGTNSIESVKLLQPNSFKPCDILPTPTLVAGEAVTSLCLSICLLFRTISQKPMQLGSPNLFHDESRKPIYFRVKSSKIMVTSHKKHNLRGTLHSCECWLLVIALYVKRVLTSSYTGKYAERSRPFLRLQKEPKS